MQVRKISAVGGFGGWDLFPAFLAVRSGIDDEQHTIKSIAVKAASQESSDRWTPVGAQSIPASHMLEVSGGTCEATDDGS